MTGQLPSARLCQAFNNRGNALLILSVLDALASYDSAVVLKPDYVEAYNNRGLVLSKPEACLGRTRELRQGNCAKARLRGGAL